MTQAFRTQDVTIAEFPINEATAQDAAVGGDAIVFGAPNVVRGGSHTGWTKASDMIAKGLCSVLASDYYYPAPLVAAFRLEAEGVLPLAKAWDWFPGRRPAQRDWLIAAFSPKNHRADVLLVDDRIALHPRVVATIGSGRIIYLADSQRLVTTHSTARSGVAAA